ncbi:hypothetical protein ACFVMC_05470 [Nocardia sp. NPDC127579]|uniref:hypothetical protein n=1 Tax=Nocardia sp. NPDC127579 TaxID=3345402 RepID=UPI00363A50A3
MNYPYSPGGYGYPQPVSGATAMTAAGLGGIIGVFNLVGPILGLTRGGLEVIGLAKLGSMVVFFAIAAIWLAGSTLIFMRKPVGRVVLLGVSGVYLALSVLSIFAVGLVVSILAILLTGTVFGCALTQSTVRWLQAPHPNTPPLYGQPAYGQPAGFAQPNPYAQPTPYGQPAAPGQYGQPAAAGQPGSFSQLEPAAQPAAPNPFDPSAQPTVFGRPDPSAHPASPGQVPGRPTPPAPSSAPDPIK